MIDDLHTSLMSVARTIDRDDDVNEARIGCSAHHLAQIANILPHAAPESCRIRPIYFPGHMA